jgi:UDP-galactopyranose mutase
LPASYDIVVHSHLRWDGVWQRPQQIISRLARDHRVCFVEEPIFRPPADAPVSAEEWAFWDGLGEPPALDARRESDALTVIRAYLPPQEEELPSVSPENKRLNFELVRDFLRENGFRDVLRWHYAPMAIYLREACPSRAVVYDCMDELSAFKGAPPELAQRERELIAEADVLFTGGRSLYQGKQNLHPRVYRFDSGVELEHFERATRPETPVPEDAARLPHPIIGYYGVIDERMDLAAIEHMARAEPGWQILLVGPVTKIQDSDLPRAANIHYTGQRRYAELPGYLKAFDVCLVPFADNAATRFLSPTKTLEYFAGLKPVVSSPVADVVENYADIVRIARSPAEYVAQVRAALAEDDPDRRRRGLEAAREKTWDAIVAQMSAIVDELMKE